MRRALLRSIFVGILAVILVLPLICRAGAEEGDEWMGKPAPEFNLQDLDGNPLVLKELAGKVVWLNFWGLRCGPCVRELPALQKLYAQHAAQGLLIIALNADGVDGDFIRKQFEAREDLQAAGVQFPIAPDPEFGVIDAYGLMGAPLNVMIDKKGVIRYRHEGYEDGDEVHYAEVVRELLAE